MLKSAKFNDDRTHRYFLGRLWEPHHSKILFIGLNPSTADEHEDDHTVRRLIRFSQDWGFGGFYLMNAYSFVATEPPDMKQYYLKLSVHQERIVHRQNVKMILDRASICSMVVFCWGANVHHDDKPISTLVKKFGDARCFGKTKDGHPKHPLYLSSHTQLIKYS